MKFLNSFIFVSVAIYILVFGIINLFDLQNTEYEPPTTSGYWWWIFDYNKTNQLINLAVVSTIAGLVGLIIIIASYTSFQKNLRT